MEGSRHFCNSVLSYWFPEGSCHFQVPQGPQDKAHPIFSSTRAVVKTVYFANSSGALGALQSWHLPRLLPELEVQAAGCRKSQDQTAVSPSIPRDPEVTLRHDIQF